ncbi:Endonuclease/exonuclease/phosphatase [Syncephalis fuscata]|nr:Endonuclease/exonuclease/phosphatase [Syncephalis fuscata]
MTSSMRGPYGNGSPPVRSGSPTQSQSSPYHPPVYLSQTQRYNMSMKAAGFGMAGATMVSAQTNSMGMGGMPGSSYGVPSGLVNMTPQRQQQLSLQQLSRQSSAPHHHARLATAVARRDINLQNAASHGNGNDTRTPTEEILGLNLNSRGYPGDDIVSSRATNGDNGATASSASNGNSVQRWHSLDLGGMGLRNLCTGLFRYSFLTSLYVNHNQLGYLPSSISQLRTLRLLDASGNKLTSLPSELGLLVELRELLLFDNLLTELPPELGTLYQLETLGLEGNPIQEPIKSMIATESTSAVTGYLRDNCPPPAPPLEREWKSFDPDPSVGDPFTVMSYNILCEKYASPTQYSCTPSWALAWDSRREVIIQEIKAMDADLMCLQEVEGGQHEEFFKHHLGSTHDSVLWQKSRAKTMASKEKRVVDGCATFYRSSIFQLIDQRIIEFNEIAIQRSDFQKSDEIFQRFMTKDNIAGVAFFRHIPTGLPIIVANTHIHWDPEHKDVKLVQIAMLMEELETLTAQWSKEHSMAGTINNGPKYTQAFQIPILVVGDMNSEPNSGVVEFLTKGSVLPDHPDFAQQVYGSFCEDGIKHRFQLRNAYADIPEMRYTNYTPKFKGVIDYIWYNSSSLTCGGALGAVDSAYLARAVGCPDANFPSDHFSILSELRFRASTSSTRNTPGQGGGGGGGGNSRRAFTYRKTS